MKRYLRLLYFACFLCLTNFTYAQELPYFTQYREYQGLINPAAMSSDFLVNDFYNLSVGLSHRHEGIKGFSEVPVTTSLRVEWISGNRYQQGSRILLGGHIINDQFGPTGFTGGFGRIAVILGADPRREALSAGFNVGLIQFRISNPEFNTPQNSLPEITPQLYHNLGFGLFYRKRIAGYYTTDFYGGFSVPQLFYLDRTQREEDGKYFSKMDPQMYVVLGAYFYTAESSFWEPSIWFKRLPNVRSQDYENIHVDFNLRYKMSESFWLGAGYGMGLSEGSDPKIVHLEAGFLASRSFISKAPYLKIGLGYDFFLNGPLSWHYNPIELNLSFLLSK